jgi:hypothetical protein
MSYPQSQAFTREAQALSPNERPVLLLRVLHPLLTSPIMLCNDNLALTHNDGTVTGEYLPCGMRFIWPDEQDKQAPKSQFSISNTGRDLMQIVDATAGLRYAKLVFTWVLRSSPNVIERSETLEVQSASANDQALSFDLGYNPLLRKPAMPHTESPSQYPGLYA